MEKLKELYRELRSDKACKEVRKKNIKLVLLDVDFKN
jgi:hypothetical protein